MELYTKKDIEELKNDKQYYMPSALFDTMQYKLIRLEVKWAYVACLNVLIETPLYDKDNHGYIKDDNPRVIDILKDLANKEVDQNKISGYLDEMADNGLIERKGRDVYLKKMSTIF